MIDVFVTLAFAAPLHTRHNDMPQRNRPRLAGEGRGGGGVQVRRSMHQDCLLNPRNFVFYPSFTPFFAHFQRLDARNPENTAKKQGENGKKSRKIGENGGS